MDLYRASAQATSRLLTKSYSTSFRLATRLFGSDIRPHIYNIYALARIADEIVDTYDGEGQAEYLWQLENEVNRSLETGYSTNLVIQAFIDTARIFNIQKDLLEPFFASMRLDLPEASYDPTIYQTYIYGSAEVIGLMCLRVFCNGDEKQYKRLKPGARALGSAFQKVNFLRDMADDYTRLGRYYFPVGSYESFSEPTKQAIITDIEKDFANCRPAVKALPRSSRIAVMVAYRYYYELLQNLVATPAETLTHKRQRISNPKKLWILITTYLYESLKSSKALS